MIRITRGCDICLGIQNEYEFKYQHLLNIKEKTGAELGQAQIKLDDIVEVVV